MAIVRELVTLVTFRLQGFAEAQAAVLRVKQSLGGLGGAGEGAGLRTATGARAASHSLNEASVASGRMAQGLEEAGAAGERSGERIRRGIESANERAMQFRETLRGLLETLAIGFGIHEFTELTNSWATISATIENATKSQDEFVQSRQRLVDMSRAARIDFEGPANLFAQLKLSQQDTKLSNEQVFQAVDTISKGIALGHRSADANQRAIRQFDDFISLNKITQQHLNSLTVDSPTLARALKEAAGGGRALETAIKTHKADAEYVLGLVAKMGPLINKQFGNIPFTFGNAAQRIKDDVEEILGKIFVDTHVISDTLEVVVDVFDSIVDGTDRAAKFLGGYKNLAITVGDVILAFLSAAIARTAVWAAELAIAELPWLLMAAAIAAVGLAIQDVWVWTRGGESITGRLLGSFQQWQPTIDRARAAIVGVWTSLVSFPWQAQLASVGLSWDNVKGFALGVVSAIQENIREIATFFGWFGKVNAAAKDTSVKGWLAENFSELRTIIGWFQTLDGYLNKVNAFASSAGGRLYESVMSGLGFTQAPAAPRPAGAPEPGAPASPPVGNSAQEASARASFVSSAAAALRGLGDAGNAGSLVPSVSTSSLTSNSSVINTHAPSMTNNITNNITATSSQPGAVAVAASAGTQGGITTSLGSYSRFRMPDFAPAAEVGVAAY